MARYLSDQSKIVLLLESGTYGVLSGNGFWPGQVQSYDITENENIIQTRYVGQGNRFVGQFQAGPSDVEGTLTLFPQEWRLLGFALGSIATVSGTAQSDNYAHYLSVVNTGQRGNAFTSGVFNPFISFTVEESRTGPTANQQFKRTIKGANVNTYALNISQSEPISVETSFIAQVGSWYSGNSTAVTAGSNRPYLWSDAVLQIPGATTQESVKNLSLNIDNNLTAPHYINGSRVVQVPYPVNLDITLTATQDLDSNTAGSLYDTFFKGGSQFNAVLDINNTVETGSHRLIVTLSGCRMTEMSVPAQIGGVTEVNYTLVPGSLSAIAYDRVPLYTLF